MIDYGMALTNCAMMNVPPSEAGRLSLWEYEAMLYNWNKVHNPDEVADVPHPDIMQAKIDALKAKPELLQRKNPGKSKKKRRT